MALSYIQLSIDYFLGTLGKKDKINTSILSHILSRSFAFIPLLMLIFPEILYGIKRDEKSYKPQVIDYRGDHESLIETAKLIVDFIKKEENLLNPDFSIADICRALNLKSRDVLYCFKSILKTKFTSLKKELRIELAKKELANGKLNSHSMEGIWMKCGFTSKTTFFVSFKEITGMTPLDYLKTIEPKYVDAY
jgi:AraC-like DNA-binding protein